MALTVRLRNSALDSLIRVHVPAPLVHHPLPHARAAAAGRGPRRGSGRAGCRGTPPPRGGRPSTTGLEAVVPRDLVPGVVGPAQVARVHRRRSRSSAKRRPTSSAWRWPVARQRRVDDVAHRTAARVADVLLPVPDEHELGDRLDVGEEGVVEDRRQATNGRRAGHRAEPTARAGIADPARTALCRRLVSGCGPRCPGRAPWGSSPGGPRSGSPSMPRRAARRSRGCRSGWEPPPR